MESPPPVFSPRGASLKQTSPKQKPQVNWAAAFSNNIRTTFNLSQNINQDMDSLLNDLDNAAQRMTLMALEIENQKLSMNPKTILAEAGTYRTATTTLNELAVIPTTVTENLQDDTDFWNSILSDYSSLVHKIPQLLNSKIRAGIPPMLRPKIWMTMCDAQPDRFALLYPNLVREESPFDRIIKRDLPRTFPKVDMFKDENGQGQLMLYNILKAYSIYDSEVGYCQGLSFVVGPLLLQKVSEIDTFSILVRLMEEPNKKFDHSDAVSNASMSPTKSTRPYALRSLFTPQMLGLHLLLYQHTKLLEKILPKLYKHFKKHNVNPSMYASQWFLTIFSYNFPFPLVFRIFDIIFAEGALMTILRFSISLLKNNESYLIGLDEFEDILNHLKGENLFVIYDNDYELAVSDAMEQTADVNEVELERLRRSFEDEHSTAEISTMRTLVSQLRDDSVKMLRTLNELSARNAILEKENMNFDVFKKGSNIEVDKIRSDLLIMQAELANEMEKNSCLEAENFRLKREVEKMKGGRDVGVSPELDADIGLSMIQ